MTDLARYCAELVQVLSRLKTDHSRGRTELIEVGAKLSALITTKGRFLSSELPKYTA